LKIKKKNNRTDPISYTYWLMIWGMEMFHVTMRTPKSKPLFRQACIARDPVYRCTYQFGSMHANPLWYLNRQVQLEIGVKEGGFVRVLKSTD
jgi:hypothetical protein